MKKLFIIALIGIAIGCAAYGGVLLQKTQIKQPPIEMPTAGHVVLQGILVCLPHKDTNGPQTMECAFGLQDETGRYFGIRDTDPQYKNLMGVPSNTPVEVEGEFTPKEDEKYQSIGLIEVTRISTLSLTPSTE